MDFSVLLDPAFLMQNLVDGLSKGAVFAVFALGFTLIFGVLDIINLAHAATFMVSAFVGWLVLAAAGLPLPIGLLAAMAAGALVAVFLEFVAFRPLRREGADRLSPMISSIGASLIMISLTEAIFGAHTRRFPDAVLNPAPWLFGGQYGVRVTPAQVLMIVTSLVITLALGWALRKTRAGKAIRALTASRKAALLLGIEVNRMIVVTFAMAGALAGAAGILVALLTNNITPGMGSQIELRGLAVVILGGMGSLEGAVLGGFFLGLADTFAIAYLPNGSDMKDAVVFLLLFVILMVRPQGLLGQKEVDRS